MSLPKLSLQERQDQITADLTRIQPYTGWMWKVKKYANEIRGNRFLPGDTVMVEIQDGKRHFSLVFRNDTTLDSVRMGGHHDGVKLDESLVALYFSQVGEGTYEVSLPAHDSMVMWAISSHKEIIISDGNTLRILVNFPLEEILDLFGHFYSRKATARNFRHPEKIKEFLIEKNIPYLVSDGENGEVVFKSLV